MCHAVGTKVSQQLLGIVGADRVDLVSIQNPTLEQVYVAVVIVDAALVVGDLGHGPELLPPEYPLKRRVVNADHAAGLLEEGVVGMTGFQQQRQQAGVPVVAVGDVRGETKLLTGMESCCREEGKALAVVRISLIVFSIKLGTVKILRTVDEIDANTIQLHLVNAITDIRQTRVGGQPARCHQFCLIPVFYRLVEGEHDSDIMPLLGQIHWQRSGNIRQATSLDQPLDLRGNKQDFQWVNSQLLLP